MGTDEERVLTAKLTSALRDFMSRPVDETARITVQKLNPEQRQAFLEILIRFRPSAYWLAAFTRRLSELSEDLPTQADRILRNAQMDALLEQFPPDMRREILEESVSLLTDLIAKRIMRLPPEDREKGIDELVMAGTHPKGIELLRQRLDDLGYRRLG